jgi:RNA-directed DNA polymerase
LIEGRRRQVPEHVLQNALATVAQLRKRSPELPPVLSLRHLAHEASVDYGLLRAVVSRKLADPYTTFRIHKRRSSQVRPSYRNICVPEPALLKVQRWIAQRILAHAPVHEASFAYAPGSSIGRAARDHCGARWLVKLDIVAFFESISEIDVYRVFRRLGYQPLISFEMSRICTRVHGGKRYDRRRWQGKPFANRVIREYEFPTLGHLPQGAPSSPMLANLAVHELDARIAEVATALDWAYTRYADDLTFSTDRALSSREHARRLIRHIYRVVAANGFSPNISKTAVIPPGSRKVVLGLLVNGQEPRLTRHFKQRIRQHLYFLKSVGPAPHAQARGFSSVVGLRNHVEGLVRFAQSIESEFAAQCWRDLKSVVWPL